jgi:hypothetical protein
LLHQPKTKEQLFFGRTLKRIAIGGNIGGCFIRSLMISGIKLAE